MGNSNTITTGHGNNRIAQYWKPSNPDDLCGSQLERLIFQRDQAKEFLADYKKDTYNADYNKKATDTLAKQVADLEVQIANQEKKCEAEKTEEKPNFFGRFFNWVMN